MQRLMLKGKIHRAVVTHSALDYEGSCAIDEALMDAADILPNEVVQVWNITNGERFNTYAFPAPKGSGAVSMLGAASHKAREGDLVILASYAYMSDEEAIKRKPKIVFVDEKNCIIDKRSFEVRVYPSPPSPLPVGEG